MSRMLEIDTNKSQSDEIDLRQLLIAVLRTRKVLLIALVLLSMLFWGGVTLLGVAKPAVSTYTATLQLVFPGAADGKYPNGATFSPEDLVAPSVVDAVYEASGLDAFFRDRNDFARSLSARPYAPDRQLIINRYNAAMDPKRMTPAEMQIAQNAMRQELENATKGMVALSMSVSANRLVPETLVQKVLRDIPKEWAQQAIDRRGVVQLDVALYSEQMIDAEFVSNMEPLIVFDYLRDKVSMVRLNVDRLSELSNANVVRDPQTGLGLADLERSLNDLDRYYISNLMVPLRRLQIAESPSAVKFYFENKMAELLRTKSELEQRAEVVRESYNIYVRNQAGIPSANQPAGGDTFGGSNTVIPQLGDGFLDRLLALANKDQDTEYRQDLTKQVMALRSEATEVDTQIQRIREIIESFERPLDDQAQELRDYYLKKVELGLPVIIEKLSQYLRVSQGLYKELSKENIGYTGLLYKETGDEIDVVTVGGILNSRNLRLYAILMFLAVITVVPAVMIRNALRSRREASAAG